MALLNLPSLEDFHVLMTLLVLKNSLAANNASLPCKLKYSPLSKNLIVAADFFENQNGFIF